MKLTGFLAGIWAVMAIASPAQADDSRWTLSTEKDGIGKIASIKGNNPKNFLILRCDKVGKATLIFGAVGVAPTQSLQLRFTGAETGQHIDARLNYVDDAKVWRMDAGDDLVTLLSGKDSRLAVKPARNPVVELSLAGSTKAIGDAMAGCSPATRPATEADVRAVIDAGYRFYYRQLGELSDDPDGFVYSPELARLIALAQEKVEIFPEADPFCKCQDFDERKFRHQIANITMNGNRATARVYVAAMGGPLVGDPVVIELVRVPSGAWAVDDVDGMKAEALAYAE